MKVIRDKRKFYAFDEIAHIRKLLSQQQGLVPIVEYGAGSITTTSKQRTIQDLVTRVAIPEKYGQVLFRLVNFMQPKNMIELGTSLGISTCYLAKAQTNATIYTLEGNPNCAALAQKTFQLLNLNHIKVIEGNFKHSFPDTLSQLTTIDMAFIDGNHQYEATMYYFSLLKQKRTDNSVFVFHDIHWSPGMEQAWNMICADPDVTLSVDIYNMGMVFFRTGVPKQQFVIRY